MARSSGRSSGGTAGRPSRGKSEGVIYNEEAIFAQYSGYQQPVASTGVSRSSSRGGVPAPAAYDQASSYANSGVPAYNQHHHAGTVDPRFMNHQQQSSNQVYTTQRRNSLTYPQQGVKGEEEEDGDGDYEEAEDDEDGEYGAPTARSSSTKGKGKGKAAPQSKPRGNNAKAGQSNGKKKSSNAYKMEDDEEDDYVEEDDDEGSYNEEDEEEMEEDVPLQQQQHTRNPPRAAAAAASSALQHPNFIPYNQMQNHQAAAASTVPPSTRRLQIRFANGQQKTAASFQNPGPSTSHDAPSEADSQYTVSSDAPHVSSANGHTFEARYTAPTTSTSTTTKRKGNVIADSEDEEEDAEGESELPSEAPTVTAHNVYAPSSLNDLPDLPPQIIVQEYKTHSGRRTMRRTLVESPATSEDENLGGGGGGRGKRRAQSKQAKKYAGEDEDDAEGDYKDDGGADAEGDERSSRRARKARLTSMAAKRNGGRVTRGSARWDGDDDDYEETERKGGGGRSYSTESSDDADAVQLSDHTSDDDIMLAAKGDAGGNGKNARGYTLRRTNKVNYNLPALFGLNPDGTAKAGPSNERSSSNDRDNKKKKKSGYGGGAQHLPFNMSGRQLGSLFGEAPDSSSDDDAATPRRGSGTYGGTSGGAMSAGGAGAMDFGYSGTPSNLGKVSGTTSKCLFSPFSDNDSRLAHVRHLFSPRQI